MCSVFAVTPVLRLVLVSVPLGGSARALAMVLSGDDFDIPLLSPLEMRRVQRTFDSPFALLPSTFAWGKNDTLMYSLKVLFKVFLKASTTDDLFASYTASLLLGISARAT